MIRVHLKIEYPYADRIIDHPTATYSEVIEDYLYVHDGSDAVVGVYRPDCWSSLEFIAPS